LRQFALLFIIGFSVVAQGADDPTAVGIVDKVENGAKVVSGDTIIPVIIGTLVQL
jgi:hypothetical protein